jgi:hypothetical protein
MRKLFLTLFLGTVFYSSKSQTYNQYEYNKAGVPVKTGYVTVTPTQSQFAPYVPPYDANLYRETQQAYREAILRKQAQYDANSKELQVLFNQCYDWAYELKKTNNTAGEKYISDIKDYANNIIYFKFDLSSEQTVSNIKNNLYQFIREIKSKIPNQ